MRSALRLLAQHPVRNAWFAARIPISRSTLLARGLSWRPYGDRDHRIRRRTTALIDGFPRSGNTTAVYSFWRGNPEAPLAHHLHAAAEVRRAVRRSIPTVVLVREPAAAIASLVLYQGGEMHPRLGVETYIAFHEGAWPVRDGIAICTFNQLLDDPMLPTRLLNRTFGTDFLELSIDAGAEAELRTAIAHAQRLRGDPERRWSVPSERRRAVRDEVVAAIRAQRRFAVAEDLYRAFVALAAQSDGKP